MKRDLIKEIIKNKFEFSLIQKEFPVLEKLKEVLQNPIYHGEGNVWIHTNMVCDSLLKQKEWGGLSREDQAVLYLGGLFHDIGKFTCTRLQDGRICSPRHGAAGAKLFRTLFYREYGEAFSLSLPLREKIAGLIRYHGLPLWLLERDNMELALMKASYSTDLKLLYLLARADLEGRICEKKDSLFDRIDYFKEYAGELQLLEGKKEFANPYARYQYFNQRLSWLDTDLYDSTEFEVIMMAGFPLSGKDTYVEEHLKGLEVVCLDHIREEFHISPAKSSKRVVQIGKDRAKEYLRKKESFVWNATNLIKDYRKGLYDLFTSYKARVHVIYLETPYQELLRRNKIRERKVPPEVIDHMIERFDMIEPYEAYQVDYLEMNGGEKLIDE